MQVLFIQDGCGCRIIRHIYIIVDSIWTHSNSGYIELAE